MSLEEIEAQLANLREQQNELSTNVQQRNDSGNVSVNRVAVKLPPFWADRPSLWFAHVDSQFTISGITSEDTRFHYVVSQLETRYAVEVEDIITNPPATNRYAVLRSKLIERLSNSEEECVRQLISDEDIGDRKPSQFLRHLRSLLGPAQLQDNILRALWLRRLPVNIQAILTAQNELPLDKLADIADKVIEVSTRTPQVSVNATTSREHTQSNDDLTAVVARLTQRIDTLEVSLRHIIVRPIMTRKHQRTRIKIRTNLQAKFAGIMPNLANKLQNVLLLALTRETPKTASNSGG
ncbi:uncharacterized protein LOC128989332 [Macrosteles quadrilineatus]|uniref:uncharacterized protein LOC128989332 n=1 Tax=Macrosteles quadrilineatus TaxID=74068 RepID=UPI0023E20D87|nr:uncharacterized protein LOC128989332 [Macrosteles quadrilineatus]